MQVFGTNEEVHEVNKSLVQKAEVAREEDRGSGSIYDSRSSLRSELSELRRRSEERRRGGEVEARSEVAQEKIRELRKQVRGSARCCKQLQNLELTPKPFIRCASISVLHPCPSVCLSVGPT